MKKPCDVCGDPGYRYYFHDGKKLSLCQAHFMLGREWVSNRLGITHKIDEQFLVELKTYFSKKY